MKVAAVNFADRGWYLDGQERLRQSLQTHGWHCDFLAFTHSDQLCCPSHNQVPYAFKVYAIRRARELGYDVVFYGDASIYAVRSLVPIIDQVTRHGYYLETTEHRVGNWSHDAALATFGVTRERAFGIPTVIAGCVAFDFRKPISNVILSAWYDLANDGSTFHGSWTNERGQVSADPRVRGHRHDQTALSLLADALNLDLLPFETYIFYATPPPPQAVFHCHPTI